jgi:hypothetical protein
MGPRPPAVVGPPRRAHLPLCRSALQAPRPSPSARGLLRRRLGRSRNRARNLVRGRGRVGSRLQLGARVLRYVGEIGRQSWRPNGRRFRLGSIVVWFGHGVSPRRDVRLTGSALVCSDGLLGRIDWFEAMRAPGERHLSRQVAWDLLPKQPGGPPSSSRRIFDPAPQTERQPPRLHLLWRGGYSGRLARAEPIPPA